MKKFLLISLVILLCGFSSFTQNKDGTVHGPSGDLHGPAFGGSTVSNPAITTALCTNETSSGLTVTCALAATSKTGDTIIAIGTCFNGSTCTNTISDSAGNSYTRAEADIQNAAASLTQSTWCAPITAGGGTTITVKNTSTIAGFQDVNAQEFSGAISCTTDKIGTAANGTGPTCTPGATGTLTAANELVILAGSTNNTYTSMTVTTFIQHSTGDTTSGYVVPSTTATLQPSVTFNSNGGCVAETIAYTT